MFSILLLTFCMYFACLTWFRSIQLKDGTTQGHHHHLAQLKAQRQKLFSAQEMSRSEIAAAEFVEELEGPSSTSIDLSVDKYVY